MHHYGTSHPTHHIRPGLAPHTHDSSPSSFSYGYSSYPDHEANIMPLAHNPTNATGFPLPTGYPPSSSVWPPNPAFHYPSSLVNPPPPSPQIHKSWLMSPPNSSFYRSVSSPGMAVLPSYHSAARVPSSSLTRPLPTPPSVPAPNVQLDPVIPVPSPPLLPANYSDLSEHTQPKPYPPPRVLPSPIGEQSSDGGHQKKHKCWMCHKSFDRPSTLRKHLLVHTGERAFQCEGCARRFSVASNLSRHAKRCAQLKNRPDPSSAAAPSPSTSDGSPAAVPAVVNATGHAESSSNVSSATRSGQTDNVAASSSAGTGKRSRKRPSDSMSSSAPDSPGAEQSDSNAAPSPSSADVGTQPPKPKRRRRAPSPSNWVPDSLKDFDLTPLPKATPVPLPPVEPYHDARTHQWEERDSFDPDMSARPYHPDGWKGRLPGPGITSLGGDGVGMGRVGGTLLVF